MAAIMKSCVDRVFARGFAYESHNGVVRGLLSGKKAVLITISGARLQLLVNSGRWNAVQVLQDTHFLRSSGFDPLDHLHFGEVVPDLPKPSPRSTWRRRGFAHDGISPWAKSSRKAEAGRKGSASGSITVDRRHKRIIGIPGCAAAKEGCAIGIA